MNVEQVRCAECYKESIGWRYLCTACWARIAKVMSGDRSISTIDDHTIVQIDLAYDVKRKDLI